MKEPRNIAIQWLQRHRRAISIAAGILAVVYPIGVHFLDKANVGLGLAEPNLFEVFTVVLLVVVCERTEHLNETVTREAFKIYRQQKDLYRDLVSEIEGSEAKEASLVQYSGSTSIDLVRKLVEEDISVKLYLQDPLTANHVASGFSYNSTKADSHQTTKINRTLNNLDDELGHLWRTAKIEIFQCSCPASAMVVKIGEDLLAIGWYVYYSQPMDKNDNNKIHTFAHDIPAVLVRKGCPEFNALNSFAIELVQKLEGRPVLRSPSMISPSPGKVMDI